MIVVFRHGGVCNTAQLKPASRQPSSSPFLYKAPHGCDRLRRSQPDSSRRFTDTATLPSRPAIRPPHPKSAKLVMSRDWPNHGHVHLHQGPGNLGDEVAIDHDIVPPGNTVKEALSIRGFDSRLVPAKARARLYQRSRPQDEGAKVFREGPQGDFPPVEEETSVATPRRVPW